MKSLLFATAISAVWGMIRKGIAALNFGAAWNADSVLDPSGYLVVRPGGVGAEQDNQGIPIITIPTAAPGGELMPAQTRYAVPPFNTVPAAAMVHGGLKSSGQYEEPSPGSITRTVTLPRAYRHVRVYDPASGTVEFDASGSSANVTIGRGPKTIEFYD